jgi:hypothetical protein
VAGQDPVTVRSVSAFLPSMFRTTTSVGLSAFHRVIQVPVDPELCAPTIQQVEAAACARGFVRTTLLERVRGRVQINAFPILWASDGRAIGD